ncbi:extensin [Iris pallida]|uniref:Extensin n=1 Tax=Iris pallida TaxID=29817 RepID=A0AAX6ESI8_IRIPA|nr:extensin [Iris pallida]
MVESTGTWEVSIGYVLVAVPRRRGSTSLRRPIDARGSGQSALCCHHFGLTMKNPGLPRRLCGGEGWI